MRRIRFASLLAVMGLAVMLATMPAAAQDEAPPVLILPINNASFLPGALFDFRVEVHAEELPADFAVTINGTDATELTGIEPMMESYTFGSSETPSQAMEWQAVTAPAPGEYVVEVTAGGETHTVTWMVREPMNHGARNVILFVADGGSAAVYTAARLVSRGMTQGFYNDELVFDNFEEVGLLHTSGIDSIITDSANSASAYNTGHKSAVNATGIYPDTTPSTLDDPRVETFAQMIRRARGMSIGVVTTSDFTDATPAAVWAHGRVRSGFNRADYALQAIGAGQAAVLFNSMPDVILGGGARFLLPFGTEGSARGEGDTADPFAMYEELGYTTAFTAGELSAAVEGGAERLLGMFHPGDMNVWLDRNVFTDNVSRFPEQPGLVDMTIAALEVLNRNENGFYLMVEAASIDKALHPMDFERAIADAIEFERSVAATMEWLEANDLLDSTLVIVTSDHAHSFDVFGTADTEITGGEGLTNEERREGVRIYNEAGFPDYRDEDGDFFPDDWDVQITLAWGKADFPDFTEDFRVSPVYRSPASCADGVCVDNPQDDPNGIAISGNLPVGSSSSVHTLQDVPVYATGPGAGHLGGVMENVEIFFAMASAIGLDPSAEDGMAPMMAAPAPMAVASASAPTPASNGLANLVSGFFMMVAGVFGGIYLGRRSARR